MQYVGEKIKSEAKKKLEKFVIAYIKRYAYEFEFLSHVVEQNADAFDDAEWLQGSLIYAKDSLEEILRENFHLDLIASTEMVNTINPIIQKETSNVTVIKEKEG